ncbi:MAG: flagella basal body P-ring formation protein FlgA [Capsulimonas sp.]|uniref:flagella basal body P-ring formation protein FlgA n=1 Tax=Capsulimonas sp. TaxID=2494211 RepID=UPI0032663BB9
MKRFLIASLGLIAVGLSHSSIAAPSPLGSAAHKIAAVSSSVAHVSMRASASVSADADGLFSLGEIADITGGDAAARARLASVTVGRAPLAASSRKLTSGDVALKMRQAGLNPSRDAVIDGSPTITVTLASAPSLPTTAAVSTHAATNSAIQAPAAAPVIAVKRGDAVAIILQEDGLSIASSGVARDPGAIGDAIRVHRTGSATDLTAVVLDAHTVQMEL